MKELPKVYDPGTVEKRIYEMWQSHGCFKGVIDPDKKPFSIVMPPPQRNRSAAHGSRARLDIAGYTDAL